jgi:hypothetical protein
MIFINKIIKNNKKIWAAGKVNSLEFFPLCAFSLTFVSFVFQCFMFKHKGHEGFHEGLKGLKKDFPDSPIIYELVN